MIGGIAFAILYSVLAIPLAYLADRTGRSCGDRRGGRRVEPIHRAVRHCHGSSGNCSCSEWGLAIGEAGGVAPSYALIADYFPPSAGRGRSPSSRSGFRSARRRNASSALISLRGRLAGGIPGDGHCRLLLALILKYFVRDLPRSAPPARRCPADASLSAGRPKAELLADGVRRLDELPVRLWPRACGPRR